MSRLKRNVNGNRSSAEIQKSLNVWCRVFSQSVKIVRAFSPRPLSLSVFLFQSIVSPLFFWQAAESKPAALLLRTYPGAKWRREIQLSGFSSSTCAPSEALKTHIFKLKIICITFECCTGWTRLNNHSGWFLSELCNFWFGQRSASVQQKPCANNPDCKITRPYWRCVMFALGRYLRWLQAKWAIWLKYKHVVMLLTHQKWDQEHWGRNIWHSGV